MKNLAQSWLWARFFIFKVFHEKNIAKTNASRRKGPIVYYVSMSQGGAVISMGVNI
jgi:hypothetical protein